MRAQVVTDDAFAPGSGRGSTSTFADTASETDVLTGTPADQSPVPRIDLSVTPSPHPLSNRLRRAAWRVVWLTLFRPSPVPFQGWRRFLLRLFGARIGTRAEAYPSARIWAPWNLDMGAYSTLADQVDCYCVDRIVLGDHSTVSQYSFLCTASHDYTHPALPLTTAPITIGHGAWVAADVFVGPGIVIGDGAVIGACARVFSDIPPWTIAVGHPARVVKRRVMGHG